MSTVTRSEASGARPSLLRRWAETFRSSDEGRSAALDALRAIAALLVIGQHTLLVAPEPALANPALHFLRSHLWVGVDLFFALSGFLIAGPFLRALLRGRELPDTKGYAARRFARIAPGYWVALTVVVLFVVRPLDPTSVAAHYLFLHNWVPGESRGLYTVAWTLAIEVFFYVVVPVGAWALRRRHPGPVSKERLLQVLFAVWAASLVWGFVWGVGWDLVPVLREHQDTWRTIVSDNLPTQLALFCPGMILAVVFSAERRSDLGDEESAPRLHGLLAQRSTLLLGLALVLAVVGIVVGGSSRTGQSLREGLFLPLACGLVLLLFLRGGPVVSAITRWLAPVGIISFGIYLWHWVVAEVLVEAGVRISVGGPWVDWLVAFVVIAAITAPLAVASWLFVEHPAMQRAAAYNRRRRAAREARAVTD